MSVLPFIILRPVRKMENYPGNKTKNIFSKRAKESFETSPPIPKIESRFRINNDDFINL